MTSMRKMVAWGLASLAAGICSPTGPSLAAPGDKTPIRIGVLAELTGVFASAGVYVHKTITAYAKVANTRGGIDGHPIELVVIDNQSKPDVAIAGFRKLVNDDKVHVIFCCGNSPLSLVAKSASKQLMVPTFVSGQAAEVIAPPDQAQWLFRPNLSQEANMRLQLEAAKTSGLKNIAMLGVNNAYGTFAGKLLATLAPEYGLTVSGSQYFEAAATDIKAQLTLLQATKPDAILVWAIGPQATLASRNAQELAIKTKIFHGMGSAYADFLRDGGSAVEGNYVSASIAMVPLSEVPKSHPLYSQIKEYSEAWMSSHGMTGDEFGRSWWDGMNLLAQAVTAKKPDLAKVEEARAMIRDGLEGIRGYNGLTGVFNMSPQDHSGLGTKGGAWLLVKDGRFTPAE